MAHAHALVLQLVRLVDLLDEAVRRCAATIKERREERGESITDQVCLFGHHSPHPMPYARYPLTCTLSWFFLGQAN